MAKKFWRNRAILCGIETTYGLLAVLTGAANAMLMSNVSFEPLLGNDLSRDLVQPYMGHQGIILDGNYGRLQGDIEIAGAGVAGDIPAYGVMLRSCGLQEVIDAGVDVQYSPVSGSFEASSILFNNDGIQQLLLGVRGTFTMSLTPGQIPRFSFTMTGLLGELTDTDLPVVDLTKFITPVPVNKANTTFSLHGLSATAAAVEGITFDIANQIEPRMLIGSESIEQVDRQMTGSIIMEQVTLSTKNWIQTARTHAKGVLAAQQGTVAGNIVMFGAEGVQIGRPTWGETQRINNNTLPVMMTPLAGNDEFLITVK